MRVVSSLWLIREPLKGSRVFSGLDLVGFGPPELSIERDRTSRDGVTEDPVAA